MLKRFLGSGFVVVGLLGGLLTTVPATAQTTILSTAQQSALGELWYAFQHPDSAFATNALEQPLVTAARKASFTATAVSAYSALIAAHKTFSWPVASPPNTTPTMANIVSWAALFPADAAVEAAVTQMNVYSAVAATGLSAAQQSALGTLWYALHSPDSAFVTNPLEPASVTTKRKGMFESAAGTALDALIAAHKTFTWPVGATPPNTATMATILSSVALLPADTSVKAAVTTMNGYSEISPCTTSQAILSGLTALNKTLAAANTTQGPATNADVVTQLKRISDRLAEETPPSCPS
jgi:hypothetical protein